MGGAGRDRRRTKPYPYHDTSSSTGRPPAPKRTNKATAAGTPQLVPAQTRLPRGEHVWHACARPPRSYPPFLPTPLRHALLTRRWFAPPRPSDFSHHHHHLPPQAATEERVGPLPSVPRMRVTATLLELRALMQAGVQEAALFTAYMLRGGLHELERKLHVGARVWGALGRWWEAALWVMVWVKVETVVRLVLC